MLVLRSFNPFDENIGITQSRTRYTMTLPLVT
jgi:hypothetical protein